VALKIVLLAGGVGGAKLAHGLARVLPPEHLTVIFNTGDDFWQYGLRICPDLDTVMYTLGGVVDPVNGWGVAGDTTAMLDALTRYGEQPWFRLGDQDVATHLLRTQALRDGERLTTITARLAARLGIETAILPATDDEIATIVETVEYGALAFQEYFVRHRWQPQVKNLHVHCIESARLTPEAAAALDEADAIVIAPSNPWLSVAPLLAIPGLRARLLALDVPRVAISPIVGGKAIKGPAAKLMQELGYEVTPAAIAEYYGAVINRFIYDEIDHDARQPAVHHLVTGTIMHTADDRARLAERLLRWIERE
jgi:LPPG:FO 2-phospho-L-lactate transferase